MLLRIAFAMVSISSIVFGGAPRAEAITPPRHWFVSSQMPEGARNYVGGVDQTTAYSGSASGVLASMTSDPNLSGTLMQRARASAYAGKTVVLSAYLKSKGLSGTAGLWFRADAVDGLVVAFKNAWSRSQVSQLVHGSTEWQQVTLVIDVPSSAVALAYGVQMSGGGIVWINHVRIETRPTRDDDADAMSLMATYNPPPTLENLSDPVNLDFEE